MDWSRGHKDSQRVLVPPSRHISASFQDVLESLVSHGETADTKRYHTVAEQLDFATLHDFQIVRRRLKESFKPFNDAALHHPSKIQDVDGRQADQDEVDFLEDLYALLKAAHFRVLSLQEWQAAIDNDFTFTNPMDVAWTSLDQSMLSRFWNRKEDEFKNAACVSDRVLIMHRGIKLSHARGKFYQEKVDLLVEYLIANPLEEYVKPTLQRLKISWKDWWPKIEVVGSQDKGLHRHDGKDPYKLTQPKPSTRDPLLDHENAKWVTRVTLKDVMPDCSSVWSHFFKDIHLQEPTFKDAILLYRRTGSSKSQKGQAKKGGKSASKSNLQQDTFGRNIYIKRFHDIPNADLEMIFPDKTVYLKPVLLIQLMFTIILGLLSVFITLLTSEASWSVLGGILSVVGTRAYQVYTTATIGRQQVLDDITDRLYEQTMDAQDGVIYFLLDEMADQHVKELLLAYFLLLDAGKAMTQRQLDKACEDFLRYKHGERVDFALENSLPSLIEDGLIHKDSQGLLHAVSLEESQTLLGKKGSSFFHSGERQFKSNIPTFSRLSSRSLKKYMKNPTSAQSSPSPLASDSKPAGVPKYPHASQQAPAPAPQIDPPAAPAPASASAPAPGAFTQSVYSIPEGISGNGKDLSSISKPIAHPNLGLYSATPMGNPTPQYDPVAAEPVHVNATPAEPQIEYEEESAEPAFHVESNQSSVPQNTGDVKVFSAQGYGSSTVAPTITGRSAAETDISRF